MKRTTDETTTDETTDIFSEEIDQNSWEGRNCKNISRGPFYFSTGHKGSSI